MRDPSTFEQSVLETCLRENLFSKGAKVLLALSGGSDSTALFHVLNRLAPELDVSLGIAHLNHQTRGEESEKDSEFVQALAKEFGLPCYVKSMDVKGWVEQEGRSFQEGARICRQSFFNEVAAARHYGVIALGHHQDDQAETVLMNILRGTGLQGLGGMPIKRDHFVRPLLSCSRQEILGYLDCLHAAYRQDSSNQDVSYLRNKVRLELIPQIEAGFASRFKTQLSRMSQLLQEDESFLSEHAKKLFQSVSQLKGDSVVLTLENLQAVHPALLNRVLRLAVHETKGNLRSIEFGHIQQVRHLLSENSEGACVLPGDIKVSRESGKLVCSHLDRHSAPTRNEKDDSSVLLKIPGETRFEAGNVTVRAHVGSNDMEFIKAQPNQAFMDFDVTGSEIEIRSYHSGDKFWPLGSMGGKKLKAWFIDQKIPKEARRQTPILTNASGDIIWVYGHQISEKVKVRPETQNILCLEGFE